MKYKSGNCVIINIELTTSDYGKIKAIVNNENVEKR